jgi:hypothetical protein
MRFKFMQVAELFFCVPGHEQHKSNEVRDDWKIVQAKIDKNTKKYETLHLCSSCMFVCNLSYTSL